METRNRRIYRRYTLSSISAPLRPLDYTRLRGTNSWMINGGENARTPSGARELFITPRIGNGSQGQRNRRNKISQSTFFAQTSRIAFRGKGPGPGNKISISCAPGCAEFTNYARVLNRTAIFRYSRACKNSGNAAAHADKNSHGAAREQTAERSNELFQPFLRSFPPPAAASAEDFSWMAQFAVIGYPRPTPRAERKTPALFFPLCTGSSTRRARGFRPFLRRRLGRPTLRR